MSTPTIRVTAEDRRQQILETATELFASQGFEGTTTRQIAERAKVNEAIIFRHFPSKEELYWAVIELKCSQSQGRERIRERLRSGGEPRQVFADIAEDFLRRREKDPSLSRLLFFSALENHGLSHRFYRTHIAEVYELLSDYIRQQIEKGTFRDVDPLMAARGFLGMIVYHFLVQELFGGKKHHKLDHKQVSETLADIWLNGMLPRNGRKSEK